MKKSLFILDGYNLIFRSYFAFIKNPLRNERGENTSAIFGFFRTLLAILKKYSPSELVVALDSIKPSFRHTAFPQYKGTRDKTPDDLITQFPHVEAMLSALHVPMIRVDGYEADDIVATLVQHRKKDAIAISIVSSDKDLMQLVDEQTRMLKPESNSFVEVDAEYVQKSKGVSPQQIGDYLALLGDSSDNIPGVAGIGAKSAVSLLATYSTLANIYDHIADIKSDSQRNKLISGKESALLSRKLVTLVDTVPLTALPTAYPLNISVRDAVQLFAAQNINSVVAAFREYTQEQIDIPAGDSDERQTAPQRSAEYELVTTLSALQGWVEKIKQSTVCAFDTETDSIDAMVAQPVGVSFATAPGDACYIPLQSPTGAVFATDVVRAHIKSILEDPQIKLVGHNIKYDIKVMTNWGVFPNGVIHDTMIAAWLLDITANSFRLDTLAKTYLGHTMIPFPDQAKQAGFATVALDEACAYAAGDADKTFALYQLFEKKLQADSGLYRLFTTTEMPLVNILSTMEIHGIGIDTERLLEFEQELRAAIATIQQEIYTLCGKTFNINSTKQLQEILFTDIGLTPIKKTKTGYSTDTNVLKLLSSKHPLPAKVLRYRIMSKLKSTYVDALPQMVNAKSKRIHTTFNIIGTATGRISSTDPNLQNIPVKDEEGRRIRYAFIPAKNYTFVSADYSQIELVIFTHLSQDATLIAAFKEDKDIHTHTASLIFQCAESDVSATQRRMAKVINFGVMYGMSPFRLANELNISQAEARLFIDNYFNTYAGVRAYIEKTIADARRTGYVSTILGRKRILVDINNSNKLVRQGAERIAVNTPIQGSAADIIKCAMINIDKYMRSKHLQSRLLLQVHDELVIEAHRAEIVEIKEMLEYEMVNAYRLTVPVQVHISEGASWGDLK